MLRGDRMSKTYEDQVLEKLDEIIEMLKDVKENTTTSIPSIWISPDQGDSNNYEYDPDYVITPWVPYVDDGTAGAPCNCDRCSPSTSGGCVKCKCRNVAVYTEDGNWWCNKCFSRHHDQDGNYRE